MKKTWYRIARECAAWLLWLLSVGRYAAIWVPEFLEAFDAELARKGTFGALMWAARDIALSVPVTVMWWIVQGLRVIFAAWKVYRKIARR